MIPPPPTSTLFPYTTLFRSVAPDRPPLVVRGEHGLGMPDPEHVGLLERSEEHTSELRHRCISYAVFCLKKKKKNKQIRHEQVTTAQNEAAERTETTGQPEES